MRGAGLVLNSDGHQEMKPVGHKMEEMKPGSHKMASTSRSGCQGYSMKAITT